MSTTYQKIRKLLIPHFLKLHEYLIMCQTFHAQSLSVILFFWWGNHIFCSTGRMEDCKMECVILRLAVVDEEIIKLSVIARSEIKTLQIESLFSSYFNIHGSFFLIKILLSSHIPHPRNIHISVLDRFPSCCSCTDILKARAHAQENSSMNPHLLIHEFKSFLKTWDILHIFSE